MISTSPALLIDDPSQSPLNLSEPVRLKDLSDSELNALAALHGLTLTNAQRESLKAQVGGHPYLCRMLFFAAATQPRALGDLLADVAAVETVLGDYLDQLRARLERQPTLLEAMQTVLRGGRSPLAAQDARRLESAGLIVRAPDGGYSVRYQLYERLAAN